MYTSGWPKNQNRCCHRIGEPPSVGVEDVGAEVAVGEQHQLRAAVSTGNAISTSMLVTSMFQVKIGMRNIVMPGRAHGEDRGDDVDRGEHAGQAGERRLPTIQRSPPSARRPDAVRQRRVARTTRSWRRRSAVRKPDDHRDAAEQVEPVAQRVEPRERHVGRADLQRHEVVREPERERHEEQEHHDAAVHREQLVVRVRRSTKLLLGLGTAATRITSASAPPMQEEAERRHHVGEPMRLWSVVVRKPSRPFGVGTGLGRLAGDVRDVRRRRSSAGLLGWLRSHGRSRPGAPRAA